MEAEEDNLCLHYEDPTSAPAHGVRGFVTRRSRHHPAAFDKLDLREKNQLAAIAGLGVLELELYGST